MSKYSNENFLKPRSEDDFDKGLMASLLSLSLEGNSKKFWIIFTVFLAFLATDIIVVNLTLNTTAAELSSTPWIGLFVILAAVFGVCQFFLLRFLKHNSDDIRRKNIQLRRSYYVIEIVQYLLFTVLLATTLQILLTSSYMILFLIMSTTISLALAIISLIILTRLFLRWSSTKKNFVVLLYGLSSVAIIINMILLLFVSNLALIQLPSIISPQSVQVLPFANPNTVEGAIQLLVAMSAIVYFILLWVSTAFLLHSYSQRMGKVKFWGIIIFPLASLIIQFLLVIPYWATNPQQNIIYVVLGQTLPGLASGILFALPYWTLARSLRQTPVSNYMIFAGLGIILFQFSTTAGVYWGPYPPFGLFSVSLTGLACFFMLVGIYSAAISAAQDSSIRRRVDKTIMDDSELVRGIAVAEMEQTLLKKVREVVKVNVDQLYEETGVQSSVTDQEIKAYVHDAISEVKKLGTHKHNREKGYPKSRDVKSRDSELD
jgi:hypothetical protein